jgi:hypothetical protein
MMYYVFVGSFGHISGGYDAGYYGYVSRYNMCALAYLVGLGSYTYSLVFATDMYCTLRLSMPTSRRF